MACWDGTLTAFETKLLQPLPIYALEQLRQRFLHAVTSTRDLKKSARATAQMAFETEAGVALAKLIELPPDVFSSVVCERQKFLTIDAEMDNYSFLVAPALDAAAEARFMPDSYVRFFATYINQPYASQRICGIAALLCISAFYLVKS